MEEILNIPIGGMISHRLGTNFTTYDIERVTEDSFAINCMSDGWLTATINTDTLRKIFSGEVKVFDLDFV